MHYILIDYIYEVGSRPLICSKFSIFAQSLSIISNVIQLRFLWGDIPVLYERVL